MIIDLLLQIYTGVSNVLVDILTPISDILAPPEAVESAFAGIATYVAMCGSVLPDNAFIHLAAGTAVMLLVNFVVMPWLIAQNVLLPFLKMLKK